MFIISEEKKNASFQTEETWNVHNICNNNNNVYCPTIFGQQDKDYKNKERVLIYTKKRFIIETDKNKINK